VNCTSGIMVGWTPPRGAGPLPSPPEGFLAQHHDLSTRLWREGTAQGVPMRARYRSVASRRQNEERTA